jgi:hypothetical protein
VITKGTCMLSDVATPGERNDIKKEAEKILYYKHLITEIQRFWNVKAKVMLVTKGSTVTISKSLRPYLSNVSRNYEIKELHKIAILCTAHIQLKVLILKYKTYSTVEIS